MSWRHKAGIAEVGSGHLPGREHEPTPQSGWSGGSSWRNRIVAKENGASLDWIIVVTEKIVGREADLSQKKVSVI